MEITLIPSWILKYVSEDFHTRYDLNVLISNCLLILLFFTFSNSLITFLGYIPHFCLIDKVTGIECPVCGITRGLCEISSGNITNAYQLNATSILVAIFIVFQIPLRIVSLTTKFATEKIYAFSKYFSKTILVIILLNWLINQFINN